MPKRILEVLLLIVVPISMGACVYFRVQEAAIITTLITLLPLAYFFFFFEKEFEIKSALPIIVLVSLAVALRIAFAPFPSIKPVFAILIITGICFGRQSGFITGALVALISNIFFGHGPWTPWQMYSWALIGYISGLFVNYVNSEKSKKRGTLLVFGLGIISAFLFSFIMDSWFILGFIRPITVASASAAFLASIPMSITYAITNVVFLGLLYLPWRRKLNRIKLKYGIN